MAYYTCYEGSIHIHPRLNAAETSFLRAFTTRWHHLRRAGPYTPSRRHAPTADPDLSKPDVYCPWRLRTPGELFLDQPEWGLPPVGVSEWLVYLREHFLRRDGHAQRNPVFAAFTFDHTLTGTVQAQGRSSGDRWQLVAADGEIAVVREHLPCPRCWVWNVHDRVRRSAAYRFRHPLPEGDARPVDVEFDEWQDREDEWEADCLAGAWRPLETLRRVEWPWPADLPLLGWWLEPGEQPQYPPPGRPPPRRWRRPSDECAPPDAQRGYGVSR